MMDVTISPVQPDDYEALLAIYAPYVQNTAITFEYDVPSTAAYAQKIETISRDYPFLVARGADGVPLGFAYAHTFYGYAAYGWCAELTIYLAQDARGKHLGTKLYNKLFEACRAMGILTVYACVTTTDRPDDPYCPSTSVAFHEVRGFKLVGRFNECGYKFGRWYDVVWLEKPLAVRGVCPAPALKTFPQVASELGY